VREIYLTHCSRDKDPAIERSGGEVTPDQLYTSPGLQRFIQYCRGKGLEWAIFSDHYGVVFPGERIRWYSKPPDSVTREEFQRLLENFISRLSGYDRIYFHHREGETHPLFKKIIALARERGLNIVELTEERINTVEDSITKGA